MSARILVVDDQDANRRYLHGKLASEYYQVQLAASGDEALERIEAAPPDIVLLDVMMPGLDGFEVCKRLKRGAQTHHIPVLMVTALDDRASRIRALDVGADDYLTKPIDDVQLLARLRNLVKMKPIVDELRAREASGRRIGLIAAERASDGGENARILLLDQDERQLARIEKALGARHDVARFGAAAGWGKPDMMIVSIASKLDGLKVIAHIRSEEATRRLSILAIGDDDDRARAMRALDLGADDIVFRPLDEDELAARVRTLIRRKRYIEQMSAALDEGLEAAMLDALTGVGNRRSFDVKIEPLVKRAATGGGALSLLMFDIDRFKAVNDEHGHAVGDALLREFAARLSATVRPLDIICRYGGEEFLVIMPGTSGDLAALAAERLRKRIAAAPFPVSPSLSLTVTASAGVAAVRPADTAEDVLQRADEALYRAKAAGRNRVMGEPPSATSSEAAAH
jgi:two-component system cell cycle response regulator